VSSCEHGSEISSSVSQRIPWTSERISVSFLSRIL